ncbi:hypothetical protein H310_07860 [Aphanomyces invadans]|uniref:Uncharacterized protein n=1 Tax=Aphanomyces invadans TaxID=157072 RepID=A0A024U086_9STRA|nr:hypothetical protein H310_07860 [Aphanomyces invadans]ETV99820.1 hypothetical protein H310_07860 [Aphanomyces invadans]|eukprot:XP_008871596.1 hypothetical protein H310_07860 [Aphanomyces invadans]
MCRSRSKRDGVSCLYGFARRCFTGPCTTRRCVRGLATASSLCTTRTSWCTVGCPPIHAVVGTPRPTPSTLVFSWNRDRRHPTTDSTSAHCAPPWVAHEPQGLETNSAQAPSRSWPLCPPRRLYRPRIYAVPSVVRRTPPFRLCPPSPRRDRPRQLARRSLQQTHVCRHLDGRCCVPALRSAVSSARGQSRPAVGGWHARQPIVRNHTPHRSAHIWPCPPSDRPLSAVSVAPVLDQCGAGAAQGI